MQNNNDENLDIALWRYGLISSFLHRGANDLTFGKMLEKASLQKYVYPDPLIVYSFGILCTE